MYSLSVLHPVSSACFWIMVFSSSVTRKVMLVYFFGFCFVVLYVLRVCVMGCICGCFGWYFNLFAVGILRFWSFCQVVFVLCVFGFLAKGMVD